MSNATPKPSKSGHPIDVDMEDALCAIGFSQSEINDGAPDGVVIFKYTRKQAIEDGVLVDLMEPPLLGIVLQAGFRLPVAMTSAAFEATIGKGELPAGQDRTGRLWDVLMVLRVAMKKLPPGEDRVFFDVSVWDGQRHNTVKLWCLCGPGDEGEPVLTLMLEGED